MSLGYAQKLSFREDVGTVGMSEIFDPPHVLQQKESTNFVSLSKDIVVQNLKDLAVQDKCCGQFSIIERKILSDQRNEISTYTVVTNIVRYDGLAHNANSNEVNRDENLGETVNLKSDGFCVTGCKDEKAKKKLKVY